MDTHSQNQEQADKLEIETSQYTCHTKISEFTVYYSWK